MQKIILLPFLILLIFSCSEEEEKKVEKKKSNFNVPTDLSFQNNAISLISSDSNIVSYGSIKMNQLLTKGIINSEMGKSSVMKITLKDLEKMGDYINMGVPLYYAISYEDVESSPMVMMPNILLFGKVKDSKNLISMLKDKNTDAILRKSKTYTLIEDGPMAMAVSNDEFIARIVTGGSQKSSQSEMDELMSSLHANKINSDVQANLDQSKDITIAYNQVGLMKVVKNMPMYENNSLMKNDLMALNMIQSSSMNLAFEKGEIKLSMNSLYSDKMEEFSFFNQNSKAVIEKLGQGNAAGALAVNINVEEIERFRKKYYPQSITNQLNSLNNPLISEMIPKELALIEAIVMKEGIRSFMDGQMGAALFIEKESNPEGNFYMGIGPNLKKIIEESDIKEFLGLLYSFNLNNWEISGYSSEKHAPIRGEGINAEKFKNFGEKPFSMYIDFTKIPTEGLLSAIDRSLKDYEVLLEMIDLVTLEFDMNGADFTIQLKDKSKNSLSQLADQFYKFLSIDQILKMI